MKTNAAKLALGLVIMSCLASALWAQESKPPQKPRPTIIAFGSDSPERGTTRVGYWNNEKNRGHRSERAAMLVSIGQTHFAQTNDNLAIESYEKALADYE